MNQIRTALAGLATLCLCLPMTTLAQNMNLNRLSDKEYDAFCQAMYDEYQKDSQKAFEKAYTVLMTMIGLDKKPEVQGIFKVNITYTINTLLLVVANANKIHRGDKFIKEYKEQMDWTRKRLTSEADIMLLETMTDLFIRENAKLKPQKKWFWQ
jgi:hypothetical protein